MSETQNQLLVEASDQLLKAFPGESSGAGIISDLRALPSRVFKYIKEKAIDVAGYTLARVKSNYLGIDYKVVQDGFSKSSTQDEAEQLFADSQDAARAIVEDFDVTPSS